MTRYADILDQRDPLRGAMAGSVILHASIIGLLLFSWYWTNRHREELGDQNPAGGPAYTVSAVNKIPIPQSEAPQNPVAADTKSMLPNAPAKQEAEKKIQPPEKDAFEIPDKVRKQAPKPVHQQTYRQPTPPNQIYSDVRTAVSSPMYSAQSGSGRVGIGPNSPLGSRLGWYAEIVRRVIAEQWQTNGLSASTQRSPAVVSFTIQRDGSVRDVRIIGSSGNPNIDDTAQRAIYLAKLPPLPPQVTDNSITAQFTFNLR